MPPFEKDDDDFFGWDSGGVGLCWWVQMAPYWQMVKKMRIDSDQDGNEKPGLDDVIAGDGDSSRQ